MGIIKHLLALQNTTRLKNLFNPLHHRSLFPSQTLLSSLTTKTYSTTSPDNQIYSALPSPFTLTHQMSLHFFYPRKDHLKELVKINPKAEAATVFCGFSKANKDYKPKTGDGADGGGIVLHVVAWGYRALHLADEVLLQFGRDFKIYAFVTVPDGYVIVRIESFSNEYGCPSIEMLNSYFKKYRQRLVEDSAAGVMPDDLGLKVGCPGLHRLLKVPDDLSRFKDLPMRVSYVESNGKEQDWVYFCALLKKNLAIVFGICLISTQ